MGKYMDYVQMCGYADVQIWVKSIRINQHLHRGG